MSDELERDYGILLEWVKAHDSGAPYMDHPAFDALSRLRTHITQLKERKAAWQRLVALPDAEAQRRLKMWQDEDYPAQLSELRSQLKEREAEVELIVHGLESRIGEAESRYTTLQEAVRAYLEHRHRQHEWRCDTSECAAYERLRQLIPTTEGADA